MTDKQTLQQWEEYRLNLMRSTQVIVEEPAVKAERIKKLESDNEEWYKYYFPNYCYAEPARFHKKSSRQYIDNETVWMVRPWSRELAKSARTMMDNFYLAFVKKQIKLLMLISETNESAIKLLKPYKLNLENNQRIINDYGEQKNNRDWTDDYFKTKKGITFMGFGAGQSPRGSRDEEYRPDTLVFDDLDTDEEVRNKERIQKKWEWIEQAVIPTVSVSRAKRIIFIGNIIGKDTCITRAIKVADFYQIVNIRDAKGNSTWKEKNTEANIDWLISKMTYASAQKEYFNNPVSIGDVFKSITWGDVPRVDTLKFMIAYGDPSYSNKTTKQNSHKCVVLLAKKESNIYILGCRLDKATNNQFVSWYNELKEEHGHVKVQMYNYVENNTLQNPFFEQVLKPEFEKQNIPIKGDERKKPDKFFRVEGNLEELVRNGKIIFNKREKDNPHMKLLESHFLAFNEKTAKNLDGPDAVEGGVWVLNKKNKKTGKMKAMPLNRSTKFKF